ncbi:MAG: alpha/beta hydrolase [Nitrosomonadales bacterium]|nr:alpha/beta hydrolase [Nitrosomonadales bacterium]
MDEAGRTGVILKWSRRIRWALMLAVLGYLGVCAYMWATQRQRIYEPALLLQTTPDRLGMKFEEVHISSGSGADQGELYGWWIPAESTDAPTLLYLHGTERNIGAAHDLGNAARFHGMGYNLLMVDYRGYGKSTGGKPTEAGMYEDAESIWRYLIRQRSIGPKRTFIYGHSLGGAIALNLALHHPDAAGVIAESTFTSMMDMAERKYAYLPVDLLLNQRFDSIGKISRMKVPMLFIHGTWDSRVPYQMSQRLFESAPQPKYLKLIEGGDHGNSGMVAPLEYRAAVSEFVQRYAVPH